MVLSFTLMGAVSSPQDLTHEHELTAKLSGSSEVPGPGDLDGKGQANITLTMEGDVHLVCWNIHVKISPSLPLPPTYMLGRKVLPGPW